MKYSVSLLLALIAIWFLWSGHLEPFMLVLAAVSVGISMWVSLRMNIVDEEGAPVQMGIRPFTRFAPWLAKEIVLSNIAVAKIILSPKMPLKRNVVSVPIGPKSELGKVMLANSITLTPGTVSVKMEDDAIMVHALSFEGAADDLSGDMDRRIQKLET
jgi:multicomponent Na+:H+ antiporter subunit E